MSRSILALVPVLLAPTMVACDDTQSSRLVASAPTAAVDGLGADLEDDADVRRFDPSSFRPRPGPAGFVAPPAILANLALAIDRDGDGVPAGADCDDRDPEVFPGAPETCDGVDRNCDGHSLAPESITHIDEQGRREDMSAQFADASSSAPQNIVMDRPGTLLVCPTTVYATLDVQADLDIRAVGGRNSTVIDAGRAGTVLNISGEGLYVELHGITLAGGRADRGGALACTGANEVFLQNTSLVDSDAELGGGMYIDGCELSGIGTNLHANTARGDGAGLAIESGRVELEGALITGNRSEHGAAGMFVRANAGNATVSLYDTVIANNQAEDYAGGIGIESRGGYQATVEMECSDPEMGGMVDNMARSGAHLGLHAPAGRGAAFRMDGCTLGEEDGPGQAVVVTEQGSQVYSELDGAAVDCDGAGCN